MTTKDTTMKTRPMACMLVTSSAKKRNPSASVVAGSKMESSDVFIVPIKFTAFIKNMIGNTVQTIGKAAK